MTQGPTKYLKVDSREQEKEGILNEISIGG